MMDKLLLFFDCMAEVDDFWMNFVVDTVSRI